LVGTDEVTVRGSGLTGPYWAPIPYSWPYPAKKGAARRRVRKSKHWMLLSSVTGRIDIFLKRGSAETPDRGPAGWFADNLGLFTKQTEQYSVKEFLGRYARFLHEIHHRIVFLAEIDYEEVYLGRPKKGSDELDDAVAQAYEYFASHMESNKVLFSTFGRTNRGSKDDLEITIEAQYNRKHGDGKPGIEIRVLGIPSVLVKKPQEGNDDYQARTKRLFREQSDFRKERFSKGYENTAKVLLRDYERRLYKFFDVARTTRWLHLEWGKTGEDSKPRIKL